MEKHLNYLWCSMALVYLPRWVRCDVHQRDSWRCWAATRPVSTEQVSGPGERAPLSVIQEVFRGDLRQRHPYLLDAWCLTVSICCWWTIQKKPDFSLCFADTTLCTSVHSIRKSKWVWGTKVRHVLWGRTVFLKASTWVDLKTWVKILSFSTGICQNRCWTGDSERCWAFLWWLVCCTSLRLKIRRRVPLTMQLRVPTIQLKVLTMQLRVPTIQLRVLTMQLRKLTMQLRVPTIQLRVPTMQLRVPTIQLKVLTIQLRVPTMQLKGNQSQVYTYLLVLLQMWWTWLSLLQLLTHLQLRNWEGWFC